MLICGRKCPWLLDLYEQGHVDLSDVQHFVLDEADRMLDMVQQGRRTHSPPDAKTASEPDVQRNHAQSHWFTGQRDALPAR